MTVETGSWVKNTSLLALYRFYIDASDDQLKEIGVERVEVLSLVRWLENGESNYMITELNTIATQMLRAYRAGKHKY